MTRLELGFVVLVWFAMTMAMFVISGTARADTTFTLSWAAPTERTDGSKIQAGELTGYEVEYAGQKIGKTDKLEFPHTVKAYGEHCYRVRALAGDLRGRWSETKCAYYTAEPAAPDLMIKRIEWGG